MKNINRGIHSLPYRRSVLNGNALKLLSFHNAFHTDPLAFTAVCKTISTNENTHWKVIEGNILAWAQLENCVMSEAGVGTCLCCIGERWGFGYELSFQVSHSHFPSARANSQLWILVQHCLWEQTTVVRVQTVEAIRPSWLLLGTSSTIQASRHVVGKFWCLAITCLYVDMPTFSKRKYSQYCSMLNIGVKQLVCLCNFAGNRVPCYTCCTSNSIFLMTFSKETSLWRSGSCKERSVKFPA